MKKKLHEIQQTTLAIHDLMAELVGLQRDCRQCCRAVSLPFATPSAPAPPTPPQPDDVAVNRKTAAGRLLKSEQQVYRYRITGKLAYVQDVGSREIRYPLSALFRLYVELWGRKPSEWP